MAKTSTAAQARLTAAAALSDVGLLSQVSLLARCERSTIADLVAHLAEFDSRRLYRGEGHSSLFTYCTAVLRFSEFGSYNRIEAARAARRFPVVLDLLADGSLNLATVRMLAPHLTAENFDAVVAEAKGKSKRAVEVIVARLAPRPDAPTIVRRLPAPAPAAAVPRIEPTAALDGGSLPPVCAQFVGTRSTETAEASAATAAASLTAGASTTPLAMADEASTGAGAVSPPLVLQQAPKRAVVEPLSAERFRIQFTIGTETYERLGRVQDLLRREIPDGDIATIFERALGVLLVDAERRKSAATPRPRAGRALKPGSRHIPAQVRREVWTRDDGQCAFVAPNGRRCEARAFLEFHHCRPWAVGGPSDLPNVSLRCRTHNLWEAETYFDRGSGIELVPGQVGRAFT